MEIHQYVAAVSSFKQELIGLYEDQGVQLDRKFQPWTMEATWGYRVLDEMGNKLTGSSIGEDEIRIFYDLAHLLQPSLSYVVGHAFGLSTFALALAHQEGRIVAIDDWSEGSGGAGVREVSERIMANPRLKNVVLFSGRSPQETPAALEAAARGGPPPQIDLLFIDGLHTDEAAVADFEGALPYLHKGSVVLWHNVYSVSAGFRQGWELQSGLFDSHSVLRTHGPLGIFYSQRDHPLLHSYLRDQGLVWPRWEKYRRIGKAVAALDRKRPEPVGWRRWVLALLRRSQALVTGDSRAHKGRPV